MSQMVTRKGPVGDDKEKRQTDSPVKDMKKKIAANAEKEKQAAEKTTDKPTSEKQADKPEKSTDKKERDKSTEKVDKKEKSVEKADKKEKDKSTDKVDKKDKEKSVEKKEKAPEKSPEKKDKVDKKEEKAKDDKEKTAKVDHSEEKKTTDEKTKQNGARTLNGDQNGDTVSSEDEDLDMDRDEIFPELTYEDSDGEVFERPTPEGLPSRSYTRRSQVKAARTPETPRPASDKRADTDDSKEKVLKLKDDATSTDRKLRSSDSPKPEKKEAKKTDSPMKGEEKKEDKTIDIEVVEVENEDEARKPDTNYSRSRVKVSPYRRSTRHADLTCSSTAANYTGNNTTMEMDITETSSFISEEAPAPDSPYLSGLRNIRGRRSYKPLKEMNLRALAANRSMRSTTSVNVSEPIRPTGTVVGRKRKPENEGVELAEEALAGEDVVGGGVEPKRPRLLQRLTRPFRTLAAPRHAEIVGINTDLPLSAPVACSDAFDPEAIKPEEAVAVASTVSPPNPPGPPGPPLLVHDRPDSKRCVIV